LKLCLFIEMQTNLYKEDWIGLRALDESGRVTYIAFPGDHLSINDLEIKDFVIPYLRSSPSSVVRELSS
jgi:palmitoyl-protein thioesterase